jgi:hypothetical protein
MKSTFKIFLIGLGVILLFTVIVGLLLPGEWRAEARVSISAEPAAIHEHVGDLNRWSGWATTGLKEQDPTAVITVTGEGVGASMSWTGDRVGQGRIVITEIDPAGGIRYDAAFKGDEINARGRISYESSPEGTIVTWVEEGALPPVIGGYFGGMVSQSVQEQLQLNLEALKQAVES